VGFEFMHHGVELVGIVSCNDQYHSIVEVLFEPYIVVQEAGELALPQRDSSLFKVHFSFRFSGTQAMFK